MKKTKRNLSKTPWWPKTNKAQGHENLQNRTYSSYAALRLVSEKELFVAEAKNKK